MDPMDKVRQYHGARIRTLLRTGRTSISHHGNSNDNCNSTDTTGHITDKIDLSPLEVPEIFLMVLEYIPNHMYSTLCCVSKLWCSLTKPQIWKSISLTDSLSLQRIVPHFSSNIDSTKNIDIDLFDAPKFRDLSWLPFYFPEDRVFTNLTTIRFHGITEAPDLERKQSLLLEFIRRCPNLTKIDLRTCQLFQSYPLDFLHECPHLESLAFDFPYRTDSFGSNSWKPIPLYSGGGHWPNFRHLHIRDRFVASRASEMAAHLLQNSFRLESLILEGYTWKQHVFRHLVSRRPEENFGESREADEELRESMVSSLRLRCTDVHVEEMPKLTKLELIGPSTKTLGINMQLGDCTHGRLVELTLHEIHLKGMCVLLAKTGSLRKFSVEIFVDDGTMNGSSTDEPQWTCLGLEELTLRWDDFQRRGELIPTKKRTSMVLWKEIGSLKQLSVLRLRNCRPVSEDYIAPCPLAILRNLSQLRYLEVTHSSMWSLPEVTCVAEFWPRLSLLEFHLSKMNIFHWSWLRQMRPLLTMEDIEKADSDDED